MMGILFCEKCDTALHACKCQDEEQTMNDNLKVAKECGLFPEGEIPTEPVERFVDYQDLKESLEEYTSRILASQQAAHEAEIARLKEEIEQALAISCAEEELQKEAERLLLENSMLEKQLSAANEACAMKDAALKHAQSQPCPFGGLEIFSKALSASQQQVSEWERKQLDPLRERIAMLEAHCVWLFGMVENATDEEFARHESAMTDDQATAEAFIAECSIKALMDYESKRDTYTHTCQRCAVSYAVADGESEDCPYCGCTDEEAKAIINDLGATSKKAG